MGDHGLRPFAICLNRVDVSKRHEEDFCMIVNYFNDSSEDENEKLLSKAEELERQLSFNKYLYEVHSELVGIYRKVGDLKSLREAYQRFSEYFPLTPKLWLDWIKDEIKIAHSADEQRHVLSLFDKAVEDYLSVDVWIEYAQYSIGVSNMQTTRSILERGLTAAGLHAKDGSLLWDTLRELEHALISSTENGTEDWKVQINRLADVFKRQLSVPLLGMEGTYQEWQDWFKSLPEGLVDPKPIEWGYEKAVKTLEEYKPYEEKLLSAENDSDFLGIYRDYIKNVKDPSTVLCLYERAVVTRSLCLIPDFWLEYCMYAFKLGETAIKVSTKAVRNCPWSSELWVVKLRIMEHLQKDEKEVLACFEQGIASISPGASLELWLSYLEYIHRNSNDIEKEDKLFSQAIKQLGFQYDYFCKLSKWHARILANRGDMGTARKIWNNILHQPHMKGAAIDWLEYANLERQYGDHNHLRSLFQRALAAVGDWHISEEWLMFEREFGTLDSVLRCTEKIKSFNLEVDTPVEIVEKFIDTESNHWKVSKRMAVSLGNYPCSKKIRMSYEPFDLIEPSKEKKLILAPPANINKHIDKDPKNTVFVSNLHPSVSEEQLKELFPNASVVNLVFDRKGRSRCYGYVKFSTEEEAMTALARDRIPLDGRPVFISELKTDRHEHKPTFKYETVVESNKLFVRGLPKTKSKEEIEGIFKPHGCVDVRVVVHKNGQSKGIAYVEFADEEAAKKALEATDGMTVDGSVISVAISAPPPKKAQAAASSSRSNAPIRHPRSRLRVPLIPRALQVKWAGSSGEEASKSASVGGAPKSNADFRKLVQLSDCI